MRIKGGAADNWAALLQYRFAYGAQTHAWAGASYAGFFMAASFPSIVLLATWMQGPDGELEESLVWLPIIILLILGALQLAIALFERAVAMAVMPIFGCYFGLMAAAFFIALLLIDSWLVVATTLILIAFSTTTFTKVNGKITEKDIKRSAKEHLQFVGGNWYLTPASELGGAAESYKLKSRASSVFVSVIEYAGGIVLLAMSPVLLPLVVSLDDAPSEVMRLLLWYVATVSFVIFRRQANWFFVLFRILRSHNATPNDLKKLP